MFSATRSEVEEKLKAALAELPALRAAVLEATRADVAAELRWYRFNQRACAAVRITDVGTAWALREATEVERQRRNEAAAKAFLARRLLANAEWRVQNWRDDLEQLQRCIAPPPIEHRPEVVRRPQPPGAADFDPVVFPDGRKPEPAAAA